MFIFLDIFVIKKKKLHPRSENDSISVSFFFFFFPGIYSLLFPILTLVPALSLILRQITTVFLLNIGQRLSFGFPIYSPLSNGLYQKL